MKKQGINKRYDRNFAQVPRRWFSSSASWSLKNIYNRFIWRKCRTLCFYKSRNYKNKGEQTVEEGCLSFPNKFAKIVRPKRSCSKSFKWKGEKFDKSKRLIYCAISHETDHLNGELFIDKIPGTLEILTPEQKIKGGKTWK